VGWWGSITPNDRGKTEDAYFMASPEVKYEFCQSELLLSGDISVRSRRASFLNFNTNGTNSEQDNHITTFGVTPKAVFETDILNIHNRLIAGLDYYGNEDKTSSTHFDTNDFWATFFMNGKDRITIKKDTLGLYLTDTIEPILSCLTLNGGYRAEWANYRFDQQSMVSGLNTRRILEQGAEAGINYKYNERSSVYANYSRSFRFPAVDEWFQAQFQDVFSGTIQGGLNLNLEPQTGNNYEIGIKENSSKYVRVKANYFLMDIKHELYFDPITFANSIYDRTMRHGLELETHVYPVNNLDCIANYTYEKALIPRHKFSSGFDYTFMDSVKFSYLANFVGLRRFLNDQQNLSPRLKSYLTHDIKLSYYKYGFEIYGAIYNIFNEKYSASGTTNGTGTAQVYYPSPGVNYVMGAKYRF
jgi:outer membrane receptor protein involved in Fe transport